MSTCDIMENDSVQTDEQLTADKTTIWLTASSTQFVSHNIILQ